jgi:phage N-6-adenine-methyltransferase
VTAAAATVSQKWRIATSPSGAIVWRCPPALWLPLNREFDFTIDVAADGDNALVDRYFNAEHDALAQPWTGERVFANPPYGRELDRWTAKAVTESQDNGALVVMLLPSRTGNRWFHRYVLPNAEVRFIQGRLRFMIGGARQKDAPFDSLVAIFHPYRIGEGRLTSQPIFPGFAR